MMKPIAAAKDLARSRDANHGFEKKHACRQRPLVATKRSSGTLLQKVLDDDAVLCCLA